MSAAETIAAAINALEDLKTSSTPGPWHTFRKTLQGNRGEYDNLLHAGDYAASSEEFENPEDADLIVTLHRTIDAQLAILRFGLKRQAAVDWTHRLAGDKHREAASLEIDLARAILGDAA